MSEEEARHLLLQMKNAECWCEVGIGNPMFQGRHTSLCLSIQEYMRRTSNGCCESVSISAFHPRVQCERPSGHSGPHIAYVDDSRCSVWT